MKWIKIVEQNVLPDMKTKAWGVFTNDAIADCLGMIRWYSKWRKYCFFPSDDTVFEQECLRDIASFIEEKTKDHKRNLHG